MLLDEERTKIQHQYTKKAINLAVQGQWEEAVATTRLPGGAGTGHG